MDNKTHNQHCKSHHIIVSFYDCQLSQEYWQIVIRNYKLSTPCSAVARHYCNNNYFLVGLRSAFNDCRTALSLKFSLQQTVYLLNTIIFMREFYKHIILNQQSRFSLCIEINCINCFYNRLLQTNHLETTINTFFCKIFSFTGDSSFSNIPANLKWISSNVFHSLTCNHNHHIIILFVTGCSW